MPPYNHPLIMAGQGTLGIDVMQQAARACALSLSAALTLPFPSPSSFNHQVPNADVVVVPISGGGLISGVAVAIKALAPSVIVARCRINAHADDEARDLIPRICIIYELQVGAEPSGANDCALSKAAGQAMRLDTTDTICDGLRWVV